MHACDEPFWSLEQCIAWIASRDRELLASCSPGSIKNLVERGFDSSGMSREHPFRSYIKDEATSICDLNVFDIAAKQLLVALQSGHLVATGLFRDMKRRFEIGYMPPRVEITNIHWADYEIRPVNGWFRARAFNGSTSPYGEIRLDRSAIMLLWPEKAAVEKMTSVAKERAKGELRRMMRNSPQKQPATKKKIEQLIRSSIPGLSGEAFKDAWEEAKKEVGPEGWGRAGRPRKDPEAKSDG